MAAFFRGLLVFLFGAIVGAGGILFFTPSFNVIVSRSGSVPKPIEVAVAQAPAALPVLPVATKATPPPAPAPAPASTAVAAAPVAAAPAAPVALAASEPAIDFKSISEHLILWPTSVTVKTATTVPVMADGKKVQDLALDVGTILQVSKVLADGSLEARAKGAKFEIKSTLTDFSAELGKRVSELVAKGVKIDSPFASAAVAMTPVAAPAVTPAPTAPVAVAVVPKGPLTLAQRVDILFGNKPEEVIPAAPAAPAAPVAPAATTAVVPAAPVVEAAPATPMADPKAAEKGKDLDRKMNQLFK
jgi:2-oxoglutarate dehydrogenase E2 component (dihydrolipoamide succinyltransferase)